jgi:hypothetical protein
LPIHLHTFKLDANALADEHIQNDMPIRLLSLPAMNLVSKGDVKNHMGSAIAAVVDNCWNLPRAERDQQIHIMVKEQTDYAILSHRWLPTGELTYHDMTRMQRYISGFRKLVKWREDHPTHKSLSADTIFNIVQEEGKRDAEEMSGTALDMMKRLCEQMSEDESIRCAGLVKLIKFCELAWRYKCKYVWLDTGCINKGSSAELEESIRSMFSWYRNSVMCIVHLNETENAKPARMPRDPWFTRGWTLQELLAPTRIKFFDRFWSEITDAFNDKVADEHLGVPLWQTISSITAVPVNELLSFTPGIQNVRQRMTWVSKRKTTRVEDMAYCLIGIFDVPLPIAYGEGRMAFYRLQLQIMQRSDDKSLFVWQGLPSSYNSMLPVSPECFLRTQWDCLIATGEIEHSSVDTTYALTNSGLHICLPVYEVGDVTWVDGRSECRLEVQGLGPIAAVLRDKPTSKHIKIAILGNISSATSVVILLDCLTGIRRHKRIATENIVTVKRLQQWKEPEMIFVV